MLFYSAAITTVLLVANVAADHHMKGLGRKPHMWSFGSNGVSIYSADGSETVKNLGPEKVCYNTTSSNGSSRIRCDFNDVESDNKKYVWAAVARGESKINVFSIDNGEMVGAFQTCEDPRDLEFHSLREEMWIHCSDISDIKNSHMDVFSTNSPSSPITTRILMHNTTENLRSYGKTVVDSSLGDVAYSTVYGVPNLFKISLSDQVVTEELTPDTDDAIYGYYDLAFSEVNQHIFVRTQVCCSCNFEGADQLECDRYGSYNITQNGQQVEGQCGRHCAGGNGDKFGIFEFDTKTDKKIASHENVGGAGGAKVETMMVSPDGEFIVLFGMNGGKQVEILKAGENGVKSEVAFSIDLDFNTTLAEDDNVLSDMAFIKHKGMNVLVLSSAAENKVAIIDMSKSNPSIEYVMLRSGEFEGRVRSRQVEWAENSDYVWISGRSYKELYVVDFVKKELVKKFTDFEVRKLLSVVNNEYIDLASAIQSNIVENDVFQSSSTAAAAKSSSSSDDSASDLISYVAIGLSIVALIAVIGNVMIMNGQKKKLAMMRAESTQVPQRQQPFSAQTEQPKPLPPTAPFVEIKKDSMHEESYC